MIRITLSTKLGELRITQKELSEKTGIRPGTINDMYHGIADRVSLEQLDKICEALNCNLTEILTHTPNAIKTVEKCESSTIYKVGSKAL